jgi:hypothetical protein
MYVLAIIRARAGPSEIEAMDLLEKTTCALNQLSLRTISKVIVNHMIATAHQRAIASLNDFQLGKVGVTAT